MCAYSLCKEQEKTMIRKYIIIHALSLAAMTASAAEDDIALGRITLEAALDLAVRNNPGLQAAAHESRSVQALARQTRALPNPELEAEIEEYDRDGAGFDSSETAISLGMTIETAGKR